MIPLNCFRTLLSIILAALLAGGCEVAVPECHVADANCNPAAALLTQTIKDTSRCGSVVGGSVQNCARLNLTGTVTTHAGSGVNATSEGTGTAADIGQPYGLTSDGAALFISQLNTNRIVSLDLTTNAVTNLAGSSAGFADGTGTAAQFSTLRNISTDGTYIYVADASNARIRRVEISSASVTTLAGDGTGAHLDGVGTAAQFSFPQGVVILGNAAYVSDSGNQVLRKIDLPSAQTSTPAGMVGASGVADGIGNAAQFNSPNGLTVLDDDLYLCDSVNHTIRKVSLSTLEVSTVAGLAGASGHVDGTGTNARFNSPQSITTDGFDLYIADTTNHKIRKLDPSNHEVTTVAGLAAAEGGGPGYADGSGSGVRFNAPDGVTTDGLFLYVADFNNHRIRRIE